VPVPVPVTGTGAGLVGADTGVRLLRFGA